MSIPARQTHMQDVHFLRASLTLADLVAAGTAGIQIGTLPAGARVHASHVWIETAFNAGTTNVLDVGTLASASAFLPTATVVPGTTGQKTGAPSALTGVIAADTAVLAIYSQTGTAATTGLATVVISYSPNN